MENNFRNDAQENMNEKPVIPAEPVSAPQQNAAPAPQPEQPADPFIGAAAQQAAQNPQPQSSGSYYSPRSGESGSYIPPVNNNNGGDVPPEAPQPKRSHKGLRALGMFAAVAFISYAAIQCYQFATENEAVRRFLGKDANADTRIALQTTDGEKESEKASDAAAAQTGNANENLGTVNAQHWIDLAARENAMSIPDIVDKVTPATVGVASTFVRQGQTFSMWGFGGGETYEQEVPATGTGIIMSDDGYIITNAHVIYDSSEQYHMGEAKSVQVVLNEDYYEGETTLDAQIISYDVAEDIAVLKVNTTQNLSVAEFGNSDDLRVGELVVAIGNPLGFDLFGSVTTGIVSALNREVTINDSTMRLIQTDTAINAGNSGGPLINSYGQVIGINSSKISSSYYDEASVEGLCFAIPIKHASEVVNDLINYGYVTGKPLIGISGKAVTEEVSQAYGIPIGVYVQSVVQGSAADLAGIRVGDIIIAINDKAITDYDELNSEKEQYKAGDTITLTVTRNGKDLTFTLTLQEKKPVAEN